GQPLYIFSTDVTGSSCTGGCLNTWPPYRIEVVNTGTGLSAVDFGEIDVPGGKQTTYKGWPLYHYANETDNGAPAGNGINELWWLAKPNYTILVLNTQLVGNDGVEYTSQLTPGQGKTKFFVDAS